MQSASFFFIHQKFAVSFNSSIQKHTFKESEKANILLSFTLYCFYMHKKCKRTNFTVISAFKPEDGMNMISQKPIEYSYIYSFSLFYVMQKSRIHAYTLRYEQICLFISHIQTKSKRKEEGKQQFSDKRNEKH